MTRYKLVLLFLIASFLITGCKKNFDDILSSSLQQKNYVPVQVAALESSSDIIPIYAIGRVASDTETKLSFKTGGYVESLNAREGDYVQRGRLLGNLRTREIDAQVLKARRALDKAERDLTRVNAMYMDSVATLENVQDLTTLVEVSQADLEIATYNQQFSKIINPISGRILRRLAEPNELVSPGQPIFIIGSSGKQSYIMKINISDKDIGLIDYGTKAKISFDAFPNIEIDAIVNKIAESADRMTGTFELELAISEHKQRLRNGLIGRVTLLPVQRKEFTKIPITSISEGEGDKIIIYVPSQSDTIALKIELKVERFADDFVWVEKHSIATDKIITVGSAYLKDGQIIKIQDVDR